MEFVVFITFSICFSASENRFTHPVSALHHNFLFLFFCFCFLFLLFVSVFCFHFFVSAFCFYLFVSAFCFYLFVSIFLFPLFVSVFCFYLFVSAFCFYLFVSVFLFLSFCLCLFVLVFLFCFVLFCFFISGLLRSGGGTYLTHYRFYGSALRLYSPKKNPLLCTLCVLLEWPLGGSQLFFCGRDGCGKHAPD